MKTLKKLVKKAFYKFYRINPADYSNVEELSFGCNGRVVRSLSESKKKVCGTYILNGVEH